MGRKPQKDVPGYLGLQTQGSAAHLQGFESDEVSDTHIWVMCLTPVENSVLAAFWKTLKAGEKILLILKDVRITNVIT